MTTNPRFRAGQPASCAFVRSGCNWPQSECAGNCMTRRVDASQLTDNRAVMVAGDPEPSRSTPPTATEFAAPEPIDWLSFRPLLAAGVVTLIAYLVLGRFV